jgi:hypothetical protein
VEEAEDAADAGEERARAVRIRRPNKRVRGPNEFNLIIKSSTFPVKSLNTIIN